MIKKYMYTFGIALVCMQAGAMEVRQQGSPGLNAISPSAKNLAANFNNKIAEDKKVAEDNQKKNGEQPKAKKFMTPRTSIQGTIEHTQRVLAQLLAQHTAELQRKGVLDPAMIKERFLVRFNQNDSAEKKLKDLFFDMYIAHSGRLPNLEISALDGTTVGGNGANKVTWDTYMANGAWNTIMKNVGLSDDGCCVIL